MIGGGHKGSIKMRTYIEKKIEKQILVSFSFFCISEKADVTKQSNEEERGRGHRRSGKRGAQR